MRSRAGVMPSTSKKTKPLAPILMRRVLDADFGLEGRLEQVRRLRQVVDDRAVRALRRRGRSRRSSRPSGLSLAAASRSVSPPARGPHRCRARRAGRGWPRPAPDPCGFRPRLPHSGLHHLGLDLGDAQQHRAERAVDDALTSFSVRARRPPRRWPCRRPCPWRRCRAACRHASCPAAVTIVEGRAGLDRSERGLCGFLGRAKTSCSIVRVSGVV